MAKIQGHLSLPSFQLYREHLLQELDSYNKQVEEFKAFRETANLSKYLTKAQALNTKLELAAEKVYHNLLPVSLEIYICTLVHRHYLRLYYVLMSYL